MADNENRSSSTRVPEGAASLQASVYKTVPNNVTDTSTVCASTVSLTESTSSSLNSYLDPSCDLIRVVVAKKLQGPLDVDKLRRITAKGRSMKFPVKLMYLLEECQVESIICWAQDGLSFIIHDTKQLEEQILPKIFKDTKFNSFLRKLYRWGFMKRPMSDKKISYINHKFQRGNYSLCMDMSCSSQNVENIGHLRHEIEAARSAIAAAQQYATTVNAMNSTNKQVLQEVPRSTMDTNSNANIDMMLRMQYEEQQVHLAILKKQQEQQQRQLDAYLSAYIANQNVQNTNVHAIASSYNNNSDSMSISYANNYSTNQHMYSTPSCAISAMGQQLQHYTGNGNQVIEPINDGIDPYMSGMSPILTPTVDQQYQELQGQENQQQNQHEENNSNIIEPVDIHHTFDMDMDMNNTAELYPQRSTRTSEQNFVASTYQHSQYPQHLQVPTNTCLNSSNEMQWNTNMPNVSTNDSVSTAFSGICRRGGNY